MTKNFALVIIPIIILGIMLVGVNSAFAKTIDSPKKQLALGVLPENIVCKQERILAFMKTGDPVCVKPSTALKLENMGRLTIPEKTITQNTQNSGSTITGTTGKYQAKVQSVPAEADAVINFYVTDNDLNTSPNGIDVINTQGLLEFSINGVAVDGPATITETGPNTGVFFGKVQLPDSINGVPLKQGDVLVIKYNDQSDSSGEKNISTESIPLTKSYAQVQTSGSGSTRIGHDFVVRIYEPDANLDSKDVDRIPLSMIEYRGKGGIRTTLANPAFDANSSFLLETGKNTGIFEVTIKIPRKIGSNTVGIGDWYELRYIDTSTPSNSNEEIKLQGKIG